MVVGLRTGKYLNGFHVQEPEAQDVDHDGQYDQCQSPRPIRPPSPRRGRLQGENALRNCHRECLTAARSGQAICISYFCAGCCSICFSFCCSIIFCCCGVNLGNRSAICSRIPHGEAPGG